MSVLLDHPDADRYNNHFHPAPRVSPRLRQVVVKTEGALLLCCVWIFLNLLREIFLCGGWI